MISEKFVTMKNGDKVFYRQVGKGEPLLLIHGSYRSSYIWHNNMEQLSNYFNVYAPDRPCYGKTILKNLKGLPDMVEFIKNFCSELNIEKPFLLGESRGGGVCIRLAAKYPNFVKKLVLNSSIGLPPSELPKPPEISRTRWEWLVDRSFENQLLIKNKLLKEKLVADMEIAEPYERKRLQMLPKNYNAEGLVKEMALVSCPTMLVWGRNDPVFPVECTIRFREIMDAIQRIEIIEDSRHLSFFEYPEQFNEKVIEFLKK